MTTSVSVNEGALENAYYVYLLMKEPVSEPFRVENIIYVGKGKGSRWMQHFTSSLKNEVNGVNVSDKDQAILDALNRVDPETGYEEFAYFVQWGMSERAAFALESTLIKLLKSQPGVHLTNRVSGQHQGEYLLPVGEVRRLFGIEDLEVERVSSEALSEFVPGGSREDDVLCVVVKGSTHDLNDSSEEVAIDIDPDVEGTVPTSISRESEASAGTRRRWDPATPWTDAEARERARKYWPISGANVSNLQEIAEDGRLQVAMLVVDPREERSVVRYTWRVDPDGQWLEYWEEGESDVFYKLGRYGIPLGESFNEQEDHWLGKCLVREDGFQILRDLTAGITFAVVD